MIDPKTGADDGRGYKLSGRLMPIREYVEACQFSRWMSQQTRPNTVARNSRAAAVAMQRGIKRAARLKPRR